MEEIGGVLTCIPDGAFRFYIQGIKNAFEQLGIPCRQWDGRDATVMRCRPRLYIGCAEAYRQVMPAWLRQQFNMKVLYHTNPYGTVRVGSVDGGPVIDAKDHDVRWILEQKADGVFCYADDETVKTHYDKWFNHGLSVYGMPLAADNLSFALGEVRENYKFDVGWVGGMWPYKAKMMNAYLVPLRNKYKCGYYGWNNPWRMGPIADGELRHLFRSCKICPSVSESHTVHHPIDVPERVFKVCCSGGFTIHTPTRAMTTLGLADVIPTAADQADWFQKIEHYMKHDDERVALAAKQRQRILSAHTYLHRITRLVEEAFPEKSMVLVELKRKLLS